MKRYHYANNISDFINESSDKVIGIIVQANNGYDIQSTQLDAWRAQISILKEVLASYEGQIYFEYAIPRMGRRIDAVLIIRDVIFVLEFKVGEHDFLLSGIDQVWDYALDLKNFHETSHKHLIAPLLVATEARLETTTIELNSHEDKVLVPIKANTEILGSVIWSVLQMGDGGLIIEKDWSEGRYSPTPTIIEAAMALYNNHSVSEIARSDASAINLSQTSSALSEIIENAKTNRKKAICFLTGVPGAGKTLVGLDIATKHLDKENGTTSVFLSGNGPLVAVLREALARDTVRRKKESGDRIPKSKALREVKVFIQNVHHFRDDYLLDKGAPFDHVAIFDEAQRAWNFEQTANFMRRKKNVPDFAFSEPEFLISCLDRHKDWAVIICLVGGGQEIHTGEAGISEWINSLNRSFPHWQVFISSMLTDSEYASGRALDEVKSRSEVVMKPELHLSVSLRSFRAEHLSSMVKKLLDKDADEARKFLGLLKNKYPIVITRDVIKAKDWLKKRARGSERYGMVVSSQAYRLKPLAIDVRTPVDPIHYFLNDKHDIRSSYFLEDVATEFQIQGLELDWVCVTWDADFRSTLKGWDTYSFKGSKWQRIIKEERKSYLKNAYRVLLTRARQGMVIVVPNGNPKDETRLPKFYDATFEYLKSIGFEVL
ncbi:MAG: DUF2075 domain-containing protein [Bacteroidales bacterium]|nr:DUF2075 domain-containing protein [Bacteroidales bacterium]